MISWNCFPEDPSSHFSYSSLKPHPSAMDRNLQLLTPKNPDPADNTHGPHSLLTAVFEDHYKRRGGAEKRGNFGTEEKGFREKYRFLFTNYQRVEGNYESGRSANKSRGSCKVRRSSLEEWTRTRGRLAPRCWGMFLKLSSSMSSLCDYGSIGISRISLFPNRNRSQLMKLI